MPAVAVPLVGAHSDIFCQRQLASREENLLKKLFGEDIESTGA